MESPKPRRRWLRFTLRGLLIVVLLICVVLARIVNRANVQRDLLAALEQCGGQPVFDEEFDQQGVPVEPPSREMTRFETFVFEWFGPEYGITIVGAGFDEQPPTAEAISLLAQLPNLHSISFRDQGLTPEVLDRIGSLSGLKRVAIEDASDAMVAIIAKLPRVRALSVGGPRLTDKAMDSIRSMQDLQELTLFGCGQRSEIALEQIAQLTRLERLSLGGFKTEPDLAFLRTLKQLKSLELHDTHLKWSSVRQLRLDLPDMETITHQSRGGTGMVCVTPPEREFIAQRSSRSTAKK